MELEKIMKNKVVLFTNENYFWSFKNVLLKLTYEIYIKKQHDSLTERIKLKNHIYTSKWFYIMKLIFSKIYIPDFSDIKDLETLKEENEFDIIWKDLKSYEIDNFQFLYLKNLCIEKLNKLNYLSYKLNVSLIIVIQLYFNICIKEIINNRKKSGHQLKGNNNIDVILKKPNGANRVNKRLSTIFSGNKKNVLKMNTLMINNNFKDNIALLKFTNKKKVDDDDVIQNIISLNNNNVRHLFSKRNNSTRQKLLYCNSFTRLFIGETDKNSILSRHLSNILVLKQDNLNINGKFVDLSGGYLKRFFNKIYKKNSRELLIDDILKNILDKFKMNQKYVDKYNKRSFSTKQSHKKRYNIVNNEINKSNLYSHIKLSNQNNNEDIEKQMLKIYNYEHDKNKVKKQRNNNSAKVRYKLYLNNIKSPKKDEHSNSESFLIEKLYKELSESKCFSNKLKKRNSKMKRTINTCNNSLKKDKHNFFRNSYNNFNNNNHLRTITSKNNHYYKDSFKKNFFKMD